jgi:predicted  nucleic acid-binding Zn-ribbon protein
VKKGPSPRAADLVTEVARLTRELDECRARLKQIEKHGIAKVTAQRLAALEEGQQVARGQAVDATLAKSKAEAQLRSLQKAIAEAPGPMGWLVRRAARRLQLGV